MKFETSLTLGTLIKRYKRFLADIQFADGLVVTAHVPNTGSMIGTQEPGSPVAISHHPREDRKLKWTLELVNVNGCWVGVNTARPNHIVEEAIAADRIASLRGYSTIKREVKYGVNSRVDLLLKEDDKLCYVEVKNVTYRKGTRALFPDAVTVRGTKHLVELSNMVRQGHRAIIFYLINRSDCTSMGPAREIDPVYGENLDNALDVGVEALAYRVHNDLKVSEIDTQIKIETHR